MADDVNDELEQYEDPENKPIVLQPIINGDKFTSIINYPVIVESYEKVTRSFSGKRAYKAEFSEDERRLLSYWHTRFRKWYLETGTPKRVVMKTKTMDLLRRAVQFFATH